MKHNRCILQVGETADYNSNSSKSRRFKKKETFEENSLIYWNHLWHSTSQQQGDDFLQLIQNNVKINLFPSYHFCFTDVFSID